MQERVSESNRVKTQKEERGGREWVEDEEDEEEEEEEEEEEGEGGRVERALGWWTTTRERWGYWSA